MAGRCAERGDRQGRCSWLARLAPIRSAPHRRFCRKCPASDRPNAARASRRAGNLKAAYPDKSPAEIEQTLRGVWDNLGRFGADFAHLDRLTIYDPNAPGPCDIEFDQTTRLRFEAIRDSGRPALMFTAHLGNWELPALVAHHYGLKVSVLYRRPNLAAIADAVSTCAQAAWARWWLQARMRHCASLKLWRTAELPACWSTSTNGAGSMSIFWAAGAHQRTDRAARPPVRMSYSGRPRHPIAGKSLSRRVDRADSAGASDARWAYRHRGDDAGDHRRRRKLDPRISGAVAMAASALACRRNASARQVPARDNVSSGSVARPPSRRGCRRRDGS